jgi:hypothetical protein
MGILLTYRANQDAAESVDCCRNYLIINGLPGATRRDRTGDLLITKPPLSSPICNYFSRFTPVFGPFGPLARLVRTAENR